MFQFTRRPSRVQSAIQNTLIFYSLHLPYMQAVSHKVLLNTKFTTYVSTKPKFFTKARALLDSNVYYKQYHHTVELGRNFPKVFQQHRLSEKLRLFSRETRSFCRENPQRNTVISKEPIKGKRTPHRSFSTRPRPFRHSALRSRH